MCMAYGQCVFKVYQSFVFVLFLSFVDSFYRFTYQYKMSCTLKKVLNHILKFDFMWLSYLPNSICFSFSLFLTSYFISILSASASKSLRISWFQSFRTSNRVKIKFPPASTFSCLHRGLSSTPLSSFVWVAPVRVRLTFFFSFFQVLPVPQAKKKFNNMQWLKSISNFKFTCSYSDLITSLLISIEVTEGARFSTTPFLGHSFQKTPNEQV